MSYLFHTDELHQTVLHPEVVKLCPSFRALNSNEILFIILYADYNSIYKQFPEHERQRKAMWHAFNENEHELIQSNRIQDAITDYISLQYNPKIETARIYQKKIDAFQATMIADDSPTSIKKTADAIDDLTKRIESLYKENQADVRKKGELKGKMTLSHLEEVMSNQKMYQSIIEKRKK